jgi:hypothetical protein
MANADRPHGFRPYRAKVAGAGPKSLPVNSSLTCSAGDPLKLVDGELVAATATDQYVGYVALEACSSGDPASLEVAKADEWQFVAQCSGTYSSSSHDATFVDMEGSAGSTEFEVNEDATSVKILKVIGLADSPDNVEGANAEVIVEFTRTQGDGDDSDLIWVWAVGAGSDATFSHYAVSPVAGTVEKFLWRQGVASASSDGSNKWVLTTADAEGNDMGVSRDSDSDGCRRISRSRPARSWPRR